MNITLRYFGPLVPGTLGPLELWNPWTLGLLDLFPPPTAPHTSPYILIPPPISFSYSTPLVWFGYGGGVETFENSFKLQVQVELDLEIDTFSVHMEMTWTQA